MNTENNTNITPNSTPAKSSINPIVKWLRNIGCGLLITLILGSGGYVYWKYYSVFGEGVKSGVLNYVVLKGDIFKTYEGKLIMEGVALETVRQIESQMVMRHYKGFLE